MLSFLSVEEGKLVIKKTSFTEFNLVFFRAEHMVWFEMQPRLRSFCWIFMYILHSMAKKITFLKGNLCIHKRFIVVLYIFFSLARKENYKMRSNLRWFCVKFCHVLSWFYSSERIHDPDSATCELLKRINFLVLTTNFQETASLSIVLSFFIHKISSSKLKWFSPYMHHFCEDVGEFYTIFTFRFRFGHFSIHS